VAAAEAAAFGGTAADERRPRDELHRRVAEVVAGGWWATCGPPVRVTTPRRSTRSSSARPLFPGTTEIRLADEQLTLATVAHELAHVLAGVDRGHDEGFRAAYVDLTALLVGDEAAAALVAACAEFGCPAGSRAWAPPWWVEGATFRIVR
jgi:hypothetical protein